MAAAQHQKTFLITGANSGIGLEATRQLLDSGAKVYMLCRSEERAKAAMAELSGGDDDQKDNKNLFFIPFDAYDTSKLGESISTCTRMLDADEDEDQLFDGVLLNAGGFGDDPDMMNHHQQHSSNNGTTTTTTKVAQLNVVAHAVLVKHLISQNMLKQGATIIASGSEAAFTTPFMDWAKVDILAHLRGNVALSGPGAPYPWIKGIVALYWAAFARHHPDFYVLTVSPGAVQGTNLYKHGGATTMLTCLSKLFVMMNGTNNIEQGAMRYTNVMLNNDEGFFDKEAIPSGSFLAHRVGYNRDFGNVVDDKRGSLFGDLTIQDQAYEAVQSIVLDYSMK